MSDTLEGIKLDEETQALEPGDHERYSHYVRKEKIVESAVLDPQVFVIGGGVSQGSQYFFDSTAQAFKSNLTARDYRPLAEIKLAKMGNDAGLIGAADLARRK